MEKNQNYIKEFNNLSSNISCVSYGDELSINKQLKLITANNDFKFDVDSVEANSFLGNLYKILVQTCNVKSEITWRAIETLDKIIGAGQKEWLKKLTSEYKFTSIFSKLLLSLEDEKKIIAILNLINCLTFEKTADKYIEDPYLEPVITTLVNFLKDQNRKEILKLSLSILVNICHKNEEAACILTKMAFVSTFPDQIKNHGILAYRVFMILEGLKTLDTKDIHHFLKLIFQDINSASESHDLIKIHHCSDSLESLLDVQNIHQKIQANDIGNEVEQLLGELTKKLMNEEKIEDFFKIVLTALKFLLKLNKHLAHMFTDFLVVYLKTIISDRTSGYWEVLNFMCEFFKCELDFDIHNLLTIINGELIPAIIKDIKENRISIEDEILFLKFLSSFISNPTAISDGKILQVINCAFFDNFFKDLTDISRLDLSDENISKYLMALKALSDFSAACTTEFYAKLDDTLKLDAIVMVLAKGQLSGDEDVLMTIYNLTKMNEFPSEQVAKMIVKLRVFEEVPTGGSQKQFGNRNVFRSHQINKILMENSEETIAKINKKLETSTECLKISDVITLYQHKINYANEMIESLNESLKRYSDDNVKANQRMTYLTSILKKQETTHFKLQLMNERLSGETTKLESTNNALKQSISNFQAKIGKRENRCQSLQKNIDLLEVKIQSIANEHSETIRTYNEKLKKLEQQKEENMSRLDEMKQSLKEYEKSAKDMARRLTEFEGEENKYKSKITAHEKEISKLSKLVSNQEADLATKQAKVDQLEQELRDLDDMRNTIMSIMNKKAKK